MASVDIKNSANKKAGSIELDPAIFEVPVRSDLFHAEVRRQLALRQRGTHSTKNRSRVSGGGAKPHKQKGTGRARQGTIRAAQWAGGGTVFGPVPRAHSHGGQKKVRRAALRGALSHRLAEGALTVVDVIEISEGRTKEIVGLLLGLGLAGKSILMVISETDEKVERAARNLPRVNVLRVAGLNVYDVLRHQEIVVSQDAVAGIEARLGNNHRGVES